MLQVQGYNRTTVQTKGNTVFGIQRGAGIQQNFLLSESSPSIFSRELFLLQSTFAFNGASKSHERIGQLSNYF